MKLLIAIEIEKHLRQYWLMTPKDSIVMDDPLAAECLWPWADALNRGDLEAVVAAYEEPCLLLATLDNSPCRDRECVRRYFKELVDRQTSVEWEWVESLREGKLITFSGCYVFSFCSGPPPRRLRARFTFVCRQGSNGWRIRVHHSSMMPFADKREANPSPFSRGVRNENGSYE